MEKILTLNIPNELWVNDFSENKTANYTYTGPDKVWLVVEPSNSLANEIYDAEPQTDKIKLEVNIANASDTELAYIISVQQAKDTTYTYTYTEQTNHDGSKYDKIANPKISDYYTFKYNTALGIEKDLIVKDTTNPNYKIALDRKNYVEKYVVAFDFETADKAKIDAYLQTINTYIETISKAYPWKYVSFSVNEIPKIPVALVSLFSTLPQIA